MLKKVLILHYSIVCTILSLIIYGILTILSIDYLNEYENLFKVIIYTIFSILFSITFLYIIDRLHKYLIFLFFILIIFQTILITYIGFFSTYNISNTYGWIKIYQYTFSPIELLYLSTIFISFYIFVHNKKKIDKLYISYFLLYTYYIIVLIKTHQFANTIILVFIILFQIYITDIKLKRYLILSGSILTTFFIAIGIISMISHREDRIIGYTHQRNDLYTINYQSYISSQTIRSGGIFGTGLYSNKYSNLLPDNMNDFIIALLSETFGFIGILLLFLISILLLILIASLIWTSKSETVSYIGLSIIFNIMIHIIINVFVVLNIIPVIGVPYPFVSYGGSNMLISVFMVSTIIYLSYKSCKKVNK